MIKKKFLVATVAACLAAVALIGGTFAYFQDSTNEVVNTFTVGNVKIDLTEPKWKPENSEDLVPGAAVEKDPMITNTGRSDGYIVMKVSGMKEMTDAGFSAKYDGENWDRVDKNGNVANTSKFALADGYYVYKGGALKPGASTAPLFTKVVLSEDATEITGESYKIMGKFEDGNGLFSYEDANGKEISENVGRQPTVFNDDNTPKVVYTIEGVKGETFPSPAEAEDYIKEKLPKADVAFKFDLTVQGFAIQTDIKDSNGKTLAFNPYTNWVPKLINE